LYTNVQTVALLSASMGAARPTIKGKITDVM